VLWEQAILAAMDKVDCCGKVVLILQEVSLQQPAQTDQIFHNLYLPDPEHAEPFTITDQIFVRRIPCERFIL